MSSQRHMIAHDMVPGRFNLRAAAVVWRDGHVLIHRARSDAFWALPGGRVEWGESTTQTLARELEEELGVTAVIGELCFMAENFFTHAGIKFHELAYYFPVTLPEAFPFRDDGEICHRVQDGDAQLEFKWVRPDASVLEAHDFKPEVLRDKLSCRGAFRHLVWTDK